MEQDTRKYQLRIARDFLIDQVVFPLAATYPLPDIPVNAQNTVVFTGGTGKILLDPFQQRVQYQLQDEDKENVGITPVEANTTLILETDPLVKERDDYTFTINATKTRTGLSKKLLNAITLRIGVDVNIAPSVETEVIEFGTAVNILLPGTQNGATYTIVASDGTTALSKSVGSGEGGDLSIRTFTLEEDTPFQVKVIKTKTPSMSGLIVQQEGNPPMLIKVYPKDTIVPQVTSFEPGIDYNTVAEIVLDDTQQSVDYQLFFESVDDDTVDQGALANTAASMLVKGNGETIKLKTEKLIEDPTTYILATKRSSGVTRVIPAKVFIPVKPDPDRTLTLVETSVKQGESATIQVNNPQRGIYYQLIDENDQEIGWRVYYHKNYGVGKARVGIEMAVDEKPDNTVFLSTGPLDKDTTFRVVAKKATTGKTVGLTGSIAIKLS